MYLFYGRKGTHIIKTLITEQPSSNPIFPNCRLLPTTEAMAPVLQ